MFLILFYLTIPLIWGAVVARGIRVVDRRRNEATPRESLPQDMYEI